MNCWKFKGMRYLKDNTGGFSAGLLAVSALPSLSFILVLVLGHNPALERATAPAGSPAPG